MQECFKEHGFLVLHKTFQTTHAKNHVFRKEYPVALSLQYPTRVSWPGIPEIAAFRGAILQDRNNCELQEKCRQTLAMFVRVHETELLAIAVKSPAKSDKSGMRSAAFVIAKSVIDLCSSIASKYRY